MEKVKSRNNFIPFNPIFEYNHEDPNIMKSFFAKSDSVVNMTLYSPWSHRSSPMTLTLFSLTLTYDFDLGLIDLDL